MSRTHRTVLAVICIAFITFCAILVVQKLVGRVRLDFTEHQLYSLSNGTRNIISQLNQPMTLKLYYSRVAAMKGPEGIRFYNNYYIYVRELLEEYVNISQGKLKLEIVDPRPFTDDEEEAIQYGIRRFQISEDEGFFFGLVAETELGKDKVIEFFEPDRQEFVEYDISKLISSVTRRDKKKIGLMSSLPVMGSDMSPYMMQMMQMQGRTPERPWTITTHMRDEYELETVETEVDAIAEDIDFLMVVHPKNLPEETLYAIDQYVMRGGKLLVFLDPHCLLDQPPRDPNNPYGAVGHKASSELNVLLENWGVTMNPEQIAADRTLALKASQPPTPFVTFLGLSEDNVNQDEVITSELHSLKMLFAGSLEKVEKEGVIFKPLLTTTETGNTWKPEGPFELQYPNPEAMMRAVTDGTEPLVLACSVSGKLKSNFSDGPPAEAEEDAEEIEDTNGETEPGDESEADESGEDSETTEVLKEASEDVAVIVIADVDMISDLLAYQETFFGMAQVDDNASLVLNALDYLSGSGDLIAIRSRGRFNRPFDVVGEIEANAEKATAAEVDATNKKIEEYEQRLQELGDTATEDNQRLIQSKALSERQRIQDEIRAARKELRKLSAGKREQIEVLGAILQTINMVGAPAVVLIIAIILGAMRYSKAKSYAARRME